MQNRFLSYSQTPRRLSATNWSWNPQGFWFTISQAARASGLETTSQLMREMIRNHANVSIGLEMRSIVWTSCGLVTTTAMCLRRPSPTLHMFVWTSRSRWRRCRSHCPSRLSWKLCSSSWWTTLSIRLAWLSQWLALLSRSYFTFFCHNWEISQVSLLKVSATSLKHSPAVFY